MNLFNFPRRRDSEAERRTLRFSPEGDIEAFLNQQEAAEHKHAGVRLRAAKLVEDVDFKTGDVTSIEKDTIATRAAEKREGAIAYLLGIDGLSEGVRAKADFLSRNFSIKFRQAVPQYAGLPPLRIYGASENQIARSMAYIQAKIGNARGSLTFEPPPRHPDEGNRAYSIRCTDAFSNFNVSKAGLSASSAKDIADWRSLLPLLTVSVSKTVSLKAIAARIEEGDAEAINDITDQDRNDNFGQYIGLLCKAAITDPSVLEGKERILKKQEYITVLDEVLEEKPMAILYLSPASKGSGKEVTVKVGPGQAPKSIPLREYYRVRMVTSAAADGRILESFDGNDEYEKYWAKHPEDFHALAANAIKQKPELFLRPDLWGREDTPMAASLQDMIDTFKDDPGVMIGIIDAIDSAADLRMFADYRNEHSTGYIAFVEDVLYSKGIPPPEGPQPYEELSPSDRKAAAINTKAAIVIWRNSFLVNSIQDEANVLYTDIEKAWSSLSPSERDKLWREATDIAGDEDIAEKEISRVLDEIGDATDAAKVAQKYSTFLENIPPHVMLGSAFKTRMLKLFAAGGESFRYAPDAWRNDEQLVRAVVKANADSYKYVGAYLRGVTFTPSNKASMEILYIAMNAEVVEKGNMHWEDVGQGLKDYLASKGVEGVPSLTEMFDIIFRGAVREKPLMEIKAKDVHSPLDDPTLVALANTNRAEYIKLAAEKLRDNVAEHPEYFLDVESTVKNNFDFVEGMLEMSHTFFPYIDHKKLFLVGAPAVDLDRYRALAKKMILKDEKNFAYVSVELQKDVKFILDVFGEDEGKLIRAFAMLKPSVRIKSEFLIAFVSEIDDRWDPEKTVQFIENYILPDPIYTGTNAIEKFLIADDAKILILLMKQDIDFYRNRRIPKEAITPVVLKKMIEFMDINEVDPIAIRTLLSYTDSTVRKEYFTSNPNMIVKLFKEQPYEGVFYVDASLFTPDVLRKLSNGASDSAVDRLFLYLYDADLFTAKPNLLSNTLKSKPEIWGQLSSNTQGKLASVGFTSEAADNVKAHQEQSAEQLEVRRRSHSLNTLRQLRQRMHYYSGLLNFESITIGSENALQVFNGIEQRSDRIIERDPVMVEAVTRHISQYRILEDQILGMLDIGMVSSRRIDSVGLNTTPSRAKIDAEYFTSEVVNEGLILKHLIEKNVKGAPARSRGKKNYARANVEKMMGKLDSMIDTLYTAYKNAASPGKKAKANEVRDLLVPVYLGVIGDDVADDITKGKWSRYLQKTFE